VRLVVLLLAGVLAGRLSPVHGQPAGGNPRINLDDLRLRPAKPAGAEAEIEKSIQRLGQALAERKATSPEGGWPPLLKLAQTELLRRWADTGPDAQPDKVTPADRRLRALIHQISARSALYQGNLLEALDETARWKQWAVTDEDRGEAEKAAQIVREWPQPMWAGSPEETQMFERLVRGEATAADATQIKTWDDEDVLTFWGKVCVILHFWSQNRPEAGARFRELRGAVTENREATDFLDKLQRNHDPDQTLVDSANALWAWRNRISDVGTVAANLINQAVKEAQAFRKAHQDRLNLGWTNSAALKPAERTGFAALGGIYLVQQARLGRVHAAARELETVVQFSSPEVVKHALAVVEEMPFRADWLKDSDRQFFDDLIALKGDPARAPKQASEIFNQRRESLCSLVTAATALLFHGQVKDMETVLGAIAEYAVVQPQAKELVAHLRALGQERLGVEKSGTDKTLAGFRARVAPELGKKFKAALAVPARWPAMRLGELRKEISAVESEVSIQQTLNTAAQISPVLPAEQKRRSEATGREAVATLEKRLAALRAEQERLKAELGR
jgi:hypothetical protein